MYFQNLPLHLPDLITWAVELAEYTDCLEPAKLGVLLLSILI